MQTTNVGRMKCYQKQHPRPVVASQLLHQRTATTMLFTAKHTPHNQQSSRLFQQYGASTLAPCAPSEARIFATPHSKPTEVSNQMWTTFLPDYIRMISEEKDVKNPMEFNNSFKIASPEGAFMFPTPLAVTSVANPTESTVQKLKECGFTRSSLGRYSFFQGSGTPAMIMKVAKLGGDLYAYAPQERTSLAGVMACDTFRNLLFRTFQLYGFNAEEPPSGILKARAAGKVRPTFKKGTIPTESKGHFLPYFPGLTLPDPSTVHTFINLYARCLGKDQVTRESTLTALTRGWNTLHNTTTGRIISHMVFCVNLAKSGGFSIYPIFYKSDYTGCVILGSGPVFYQGVKTAAKTKDELVAEIDTQSSHEKALESICKILSAAKWREDDEVRTVTAEDITTARRLHYECIDRKLNTDDQAEIRKFVKLLRFKQTLYKASETDHLLEVITALKDKQRLPADAPFDLMVDALFTHSFTLSTLAAYGPIAPTPSLSQNANAVVVVRSELLKGNSQGALTGMPVFVKPITQAVEEWKSAKKTSTIQFRSKGKSSDGIQRISDVAKYVMMSEPKGKETISAFVAYAGKGSGKNKRKAGDDEEWGGLSAKESEKQTTERATKRTKIATEAQELFAGFGYDEGDADMA
ncbi:hypothetical protein [Tulasnella ambivirus 5]|uniref:Uncharacterized protein n=1 Tax=Tulasnella ambivirus 5 TaxID=2772293 RepID=A0A7S7YF51_9VIRU|nr:hypothetical protein [Tulasnella ambivirus 5]